MDRTPMRRMKAKLPENRCQDSRPARNLEHGFVHDQPATGHKLRVLTVVDTLSRFCPAFDPRSIYCGEDVVPTLECICGEIGYPDTIRVDQGSEFISRDLDLWIDAYGVTLDFSQPRKPRDNAFIEA